MLGLKEIQEIIPHRYPMLLIDRVLEYEPGVGAVALKGVTYNEPYFIGHFPDMPVMPGVYIIEALAQTGAIAILSHENYKGKHVLFGGIKNARFRNTVEPGTMLRLETKITKMKGPVGYGIAKAFVDDKIAVEAELTFFVK